MAVTLRIPEELDAELQRVAEAQHTSKHALLLKGAALVVDRHARRSAIDAGFEWVVSHDTDLLRRLEDA